MYRRFSISAVLTSFALVCSLGVLGGCSPEQTMPASLAPTVAPPAIGTADVLRVGLDASRPLFSSMGKAGIEGIDVDMASALADQLGLSIQIIDVGSNPRAALDNHEVDVLIGYEQQQEEDASLWLSEPYLVRAPALFSANSNNRLPAQGDSSRVAAQSSTQGASDISRLYGDSTLKLTQDMNESFKLLDTKEAKYVAGDSYLGTYVSFHNNVDAHMLGLLSNPRHFCLALSAGNTQLIESVDQACKTLQASGMIHLIEAKWLGERVDIDDLPVLEVQAPRTGEQD